MEKKGVKQKQKQKKKQKQKQKQKQIKKQSRLLFLWLRCVLLGWPVFLYPSMAIFFSLPVARQLIESGPGLCCVPDPISGNAVRVGSSGQTRIRSPDWCHLISPDPDLGPDLSPGSELPGFGLYVNLRRQIV